jgi:uncharacterized protein YcsI (UPF0317 family)
MLPKSEAFSFLLFCVRNPKPCPVLDVLEAGVWEPKIAPGADLRTDVPKYRIYETGNSRKRQMMSSVFFRTIWSVFFRLQFFF